MSRTKPVILRTYPDIYRTNPVIFRTNSVIYRKNTVIVRTWWGEHPLKISASYPKGFRLKVIEDILGKG